VARTANPGDQVLYVYQGRRVPATVLNTTGATGYADLSMQHPGSPWFATVLASVQNTDGTTEGTWDFAPLSGLKLDYAADAVAGDAATINKPSGRFVKDTSGTSFTLTNSFISATSQVRVVKETVEANNATVLTVVPASGSCVITLAAAPAANCTYSFYVVNGN
jgi:hypothetical protein